MKQDVVGQMNTLSHSASAEAWNGVRLGFMKHSVSTPQHLAKRLEAFGAGRHGAAFDFLSSRRNGMQLAGGNHAQRDVFERITIDSGLRVGRLDAVERIQDDHRAKRAGGEDNYALARRALIDAARDNGDAQSVPAE